MITFLTIAAVVLAGLLGALVVSHIKTVKTIGIMIGLIETLAKNQAVVGRTLQSEGLVEVERRETVH